MREFAQITKRKIDQLQETIPTDSIEPLEIDYDELFKRLEKVNKIYSMSVPTYEVPFAEKIPPGYQEAEFSGYYGSSYTIYKNDNKKAFIFWKNPENGRTESYELYRKIDASAEPIFDVFYYTKITKGIWYYYMPKGRERINYDGISEYNTNTHLLVNYDEKVLIPIPRATIANTKNMNYANPRIIRTMVLASQINPAVFDGLADLYIESKQSELVDALSKHTNKIIKEFQMQIDNYNKRILSFIADP